MKDTKNIKFFYSKAEQVEYDRRIIRDICKNQTEVEIVVNSLVNSGMIKEYLGKSRYDFAKSALIIKKCIIDKSDRTNY